MVELTDLPDDVFELLFQCLYVSDVLHLEICCKRLNSISFLYWREVTHLKLVPFLQQRGRFDVTNAFRFDNISSGLIKRVGPYVRSIDISKLGPLEYGLRLGLEAAVVDCCTRLSHLELNNRLLDKSWLVSLAKATRTTLRHSSLCHVYLRGCGGIDDETLKELLIYWCRLESLKLRDNCLLKLSCHNSLPKTLKSLDVQGCSRVYTGYLPEICRRCTVLDTLSITYAPDFLFLPAELMGSLEELNVDSSSSVLVLEKHFAAAIGSLTNLRSLSINTHLLSDWLCSLIGQNLIQLEAISFPGGRLPGLVSSVTEALLQLSKLPKLRSFSAQGNSQFGRFILVLLNRFPKLQYVNVAYAVKEVEIADMWTMISSNSLKTLDIKGLCPLTRPKSEVLSMIRSKLNDQCPLLTEIIV